MRGRREQPIATEAEPGHRGKRALVLATERRAGEELLEEIRYRGGHDARVKIVPPALVSRLEFSASDEDRGIAEADERLVACLATYRDAGMTIEGEVGDSDPLQAIEDSMRTFEPDEIIVARHPRDRANWQHPPSFRHASAPIVIAATRATSIVSATVGANIGRLHRLYEELSDR